MRNVGCEEKLARWDSPMIFIDVFLHVPCLPYVLLVVSGESESCVSNSEALLGPDHRGGQELNGFAASNIGQKR